MQKALLPIRYIWITTKMYELSHIGKPAIDFGWEKQEHWKCYAPFDGIIKRIYGEANEVWIESKEPVLWADGTYDYMTCLLIHLDDISHLYEGKEVHQNEYIGIMGTRGNWQDGTYGRHLHLEVGSGKFTGSGWYQDPSTGKWRINNGVEIPTALMITDDTFVDCDVYNWKKESEVNPIKMVGTPVARDEYKDQIEVYVDMLHCRKAPSLNGEIEGYTNLGIYNILDKQNADGYDWYKIEENRWIAYNEKWEHLYPKKEEPKPEPTLDLGDKVLVLNGYLTGDSYGGGDKTLDYDGDTNPNDPVNTKYITALNPGAPRPYHLSNGQEFGEDNIGWAKKDQLKKI